MELTDKQINRYSRQIILPEVGGKGQKKLLNSKVLVIGTGGLGSPVLMYLAAAGVGNLGISDFDKVDESNLQRQLLFTDNDLNKEKVEVATEKIKKMNQDIKIKKHQGRINENNINEIIKKYDLVVDGSDNFPTRFLVNDACYFLNKPLVHGAILRFEGRAITFIPDKGPCYRCLYPEPPPVGFMPNCQQAGIIGAVAGAIGSIMASEAIKIILEQGNLLINRMVVVDLLESKFNELSVNKNDNCLLCGNNSTIKELKEYDQTCSINEE